MVKGEYYSLCSEWMYDTIIVYNCIFLCVKRWLLKPWGPPEGLYGFAPSFLV